MSNRTPGVYPLALLLVCLAFAGLAAPTARAIDDPCAMPCGSSRDHRAASRSDCGRDAACAPTGRTTRQRSPAGAADFSALIERASAAKARRQAALSAARGELIARQRKAFEARNAERRQRERTQRQVLEDADLRKVNLIGDSLSQPGGAAELFAGFQFSEAKAAMASALDTFLRQIDPSQLPVHDQ